MVGWLFLLGFGISWTRNVTLWPFAARAFAKGSCARRWLWLPNPWKNRMLEAVVGGASRTIWVVAMKST